MSPAKNSGAWGSFAAAIEGTAKIFGNTAAINILKEGEQLGIDEYEEALHDDALGPKCRALITTTLLPPTSHAAPAANASRRKCARGPRMRRTD